MLLSNSLTDTQPNTVVHACHVVGGQQGSLQPPKAAFLSLRKLLPKNMVNFPQDICGSRDLSVLCLYFSISHGQNLALLFSIVILAVVRLADQFCPFAVMTSLIMVYYDTIRNPSTFQRSAVAKRMLSFDRLKTQTAVSRWGVNHLYACRVLCS